jgi:aminoglycoside phosphotransferase (APT) family kinase protein
VTEHPGTAYPEIAYPDVVAALTPWLAEKLGAEDLRIEGLKRHAEGWSWQTYTLTAVHAGERLGLALRVQPDDGLLPPYDVQAQYELHRFVEASGRVPIPKLYWLELDRAVLGQPFYAMELVEGPIPVQWGGKDPAIFPTDEARREIGLEFVDVLAGIHSLDPHAPELGFLDQPATPEEALDRTLDYWERFYEESLLIEVPLMREGFRWLRAHKVTSDRVVLCHCDYRIGNFILQGRRIAAVLDWELARVDDPVDDIAYSGLPLFRGRSPLLSQLLAPDEYFARYEERTGLRVDPEVFRYRTVLGLVRAAAPHLRGARAFEDGLAGDVRLGAMGHQAYYVIRQLAEELGLRSRAA